MSSALIEYCFTGLLLTGIGSCCLDSSKDFVTTPVDLTTTMTLVRVTLDIIRPFRLVETS